MARDIGCSVCFLRQGCHEPAAHHCIRIPPTVVGGHGHAPLRQQGEGRMAVLPYTRGYRLFTWRRTAPARAFNPPNDRAQKRNFKANCPMRGSFAPVTLPNVAEPKVPVGSPNWAWLKRLKNSARNWSDILSVSFVSLSSPKSQLFKPGPWKKRRLALPGTPKVSEVKGVVEKYW